MKGRCTTREISCTHCEKKFASKQTLSKHTVKIHNVKTLTISCQEENCNEKFHHLSELRDHLRSMHKFPNINNCQNLEFEKYEDFCEWLAKEEKDSDMKYVFSSRVKAKNCTYTTFSCNRSGVYKPSIEDRTRQLKAQGTCKLGFHCTSNIKVKEIDSTVSVSFFKEHYKHSTNLSHVPIPKTEKEVIAGKLLQGVQEKRILKDIRQRGTNQLKRKHLITRKDINNIKKEFGVKLHSEGSVLSNDEASVCAWVQKMKEEEAVNPVLFYKRQDEEHSILEKNDFMLIIMTPFQKNMINRFGTDRVCIDSTHGISGYQFELMTLLVIDEFEEGIPVAFCITSSIDTKTVTYFFECVKSSLNCLFKPRIFMSDDAVFFKNSWINVFSQCEKYLLCAWHVDKAWRKHINKLKSEIRADVYKTLKTLMHELDIVKFNEMLCNFCEMLKNDPDTIEFYNYFNQHYLTRVEMWAYCHRTKAKINTNMHIENFHRSLKHIYLQGKKTKRVDKVIIELMNLVHDKNYDQYLKAVKGKITKRATHNFKRHKEGKNLKAVLQEVCENRWKVVTSNNAYIVSKNHLCTNLCIIACRNCVFCATAYSCTCHDHAISNFMCKHIHFVKISLNEVHNFTGPINNPDDSIVLNDSTTDVNVSNKSTSSNRRESIKKKIISLEAQINSPTSMEDNVIIQIEKHLDAVQHLLQVKGESVSKCVKTNEPINKKILKQKRFYSVKKSHTNKKFKLTKPSFEENKDKKTILLKNVFSSNDSSFDHKY